MRILIVRLVLSLVLSETLLGTGRSHQEAAWRQQIVLFQSTRIDVEKLLGKPAAGKDYGVTYNLQDGTLYLDYYLFDHCKLGRQYYGDWNIPEWTVIEITYLPDNPPQFAALNLDLRELRKVHESPHVPDMISYVNDEEGLDYTFEGDGTTMHSIRYFPGKRFNILRCAEQRKPSKGQRR